MPVQLQVTDNYNYEVKLLYHTNYKKITLFHVFKAPDAGTLLWFKGFLHNCGRTGILFKQI